MEGLLRTICADLGGSRVKLAAVEDGAVVSAEVFDVCGKSEETLSTLVEKSRRIMARLGGTFAGISVAAPGIVDEANRRVVVCNGKYEGLENVDLVAWAKDGLGLDMRIVNDARAALLGELAYGCAKGERDAVMVILGTGVGTAAVSGGRMLSGRHFVHGILGGHLPINFDGDRRCTCGSGNCFEAYVGTWALKEMAGDTSYDYRRLADEYAAGDEKAKRLFDVVSRALGAGVVALVHAFDPETVIFSGGASRFDALLEKAVEYAKENAWTPWGELKFIKAADPESSVLLGLHSLFDEKVNILCS